MNEHVGVLEIGVWPWARVDHVVNVPVPLFDVERCGGYEHELVRDRIKQPGMPWVFWVAP